MTTTDPQDTTLRLGDLVWRGPNWFESPPWSPWATSGTTTITTGTPPTPAASAFDTEKDDLDDLFPVADEVADEMVSHGPSTYFAGPPRVAGSCPPGQHDFQLVTEEGLAMVLGQRARLVLYCQKCGTTVRHDISAPPEDDPSDDDSLPDH